MRNSTQIILGALRIAIWGIVLFGPILAALLVLSHAREIFKPILAIYQGNLGALQSTAASQSPGVINLPPVNFGGGALNNSQLQQTVRQLQTQLAPEDQANVPPSNDNHAAQELLAMQAQLARCQQQIQQLTLALEQQKELVKQLQENKPAGQEQIAQNSPAVLPPVSPEIQEREQSAYLAAIQERYAAQEALEQLKASQKVDQQQVFAAAYELMIKRSAVTRIESQRTKVRTVVMSAS